MQPFTTLTAVAAPIDLANVDTDKIIPARLLRKLRLPPKGYEPYLFHDLRFDADGSERPDFVLNQSAWRGAQILVADVNFGCGSSREGAVYALMDYGMRAVIAASFGDIHYGNAIQNGLLPAIVPQEVCATLRAHLHANPGAQLTIDLPSQMITCPPHPNPPRPLRSPAHGERASAHTDATDETYSFQIDAVYKERLLKGLDDVGLILEHLPEIEAFETRHFTARRWLA
jgi:3-isopropylmalate/(R)-2-methylmalate dehydratase small subunit